MSRKTPWLEWALLLAAGSAFAASGLAPEAASPDADAILDEVLARLPLKTLQINGELQADPRDGKPGRLCQVQLRLAYGETPPQARYTIQDAFGEELEQITILRPAGGRVSWHYAKGYPLVDATLPDPTAAIQGTDITWADLSLSFLWWRGGRLVNVERVLDRDCYRIETPAPAGEPSPYAAMRLWIDCQHLMLLRAEGLGPDGIERKRIAVKSIRKIDDEWMVKDLDVTSLPSKKRTALRIEWVDKPTVEVTAP